MTLQPAESAEPCTVTTSSEIISGGKIAYDVSGKGRVVVLLHGLFATKDQWSRFACVLADAGYETIAIDLPGYGESVGFPLAVYQLEEQVELLHALLKRIHVTMFDLAGNSMGGAIAALYVQQYPGEVRSLAFIGSPLGVAQWADPLRQAINEGINPFIPINEHQVDIELQLLFARPPSILDARKKEIAAGHVANLAHEIQVWNIVNLYDRALEDLQNPHLATLIVWGDADRVYDFSSAKRLQQMRPGSELRDLSNVGHLVHYESATASAAIYLDFLQALNN